MKGLIELGWFDGLPPKQELDLDWKKLPKPYYAERGIVIFHADCRDILPHLPKVDLVLTDPPYAGLQGGIAHMGNGLANRVRESMSVGDLWDAGYDWISLVNSAAKLGLFVFCSYQCVAEFKLHFNIPAVALLTWHKPNAPNVLRNVPRYSTEFIWVFQKQSGLNWRVFESTLLEMCFLQAGFTATERIVDVHGKSLHPTQKPVNLIKKLLSVGGDTILDPFMGSGTTLRAAKDLGRQAIGIEIEEKYCEIAVKRLAQAVLPLD